MDSGVVVVGFGDRMGEVRRLLMGRGRGVEAACKCLIVIDATALCCCCRLCGGNRCCYCGRRCCRCWPLGGQSRGNTAFSSMNLQVQLLHTGCLQLVVVVVVVLMLHWCCGRSSGVAAVQQRCTS
jgi:hypothetical protein